MGWSGAEFPVPILRLKITKVHKMFGRKGQNLFFQLGEMIIWHFDPTFRLFRRLSILEHHFLWCSLIDWIIQRVVVIHHESHVSYDESCDHSHRYGGMAWQLKCQEWSSNYNYKVSLICPQDIQGLYRATMPRYFSDTSIRNDLPVHFGVGRRTYDAFLLVACKFY